jgi:REP element-mobilizing transposase RayT
MPRASEYLLPGYTYHLTHQCHDRQFLLRFSRERDVYREWLREGVQRYGLSVYAYCITSNHVHLVVRVDKPDAVAAFVQLAAGATAKQYNLRKERTGSMWQHPYHCTVIEDGRHLLNCLCYVDLNMVRAGVVAHPERWRWCGHDELMGVRTRYRVLDLEGLAERAGLPSIDALRDWYADALQQRLGRGREPHWSESLAVGSKSFVEAMRERYAERTQFALEEAATTAPGVWTVREAAMPYEATSPQESAL